MRKNISFIPLNNDINKLSAFIPSLDASWRANQRIKSKPVMVESLDAVREFQRQGWNIAGAYEKRDKNRKVGLTNTGSQLKETITTPMSPTGQAPNIQMTGRSEPLTIAPGSQYVATGRVDQNNNPTALQYDQSGRLLGEVTIPAGVTPNMMQGAQQPGAMPPHDHSRPLSDVFDCSPSLPFVLPTSSVHS